MELGETSLHSVMFGAQQTDRAVGAARGQSRRRAPASAHVGLRGRLCVTRSINADVMQFKKYVDFY